MRKRQITQPYSEITHPYSKITLLYSEISGTYSKISGRNQHKYVLFGSKNPLNLLLLPFLQILPQFVITL